MNQEGNTVSYQDAPHAAVNELMKWVRQQGKQVVSLRLWPHLARWSELSDWSAHIEVRRNPPLHVRIKRKGYKFAIVHEPDTTGCPACVTSAASTLISSDALVRDPEPALVAQAV